MIASRRLTVAGRFRPAEAWYSTNTRKAKRAGSVPTAESRVRLSEVVSPTFSSAVMRAWR